MAGLLDEVCNKPTETVEKEKPKKNLLFDMINDIFLSPNAYKKYTKECIKQNAFMINRIMSIRYPVEASYLSGKTISPYALYYLWNTALYNGRYKEQWIYSKVAKSVNMEDLDVSQNVIDEYCNEFGISRSDFNDACRFFFEELKNDLKQFNKLKQNKAV